MTTRAAAAAAAAADVHVYPGGAEVANSGCYYLPIPEEEAAPMMLPEPIATTNDYRTRETPGRRENPHPLSLTMPNV